ncbi:DUF255 domain-containing protein [Tautonia sociabilis]|uniref:DUF255 domain-containing protein n=1 Tax=Tautonia sociabilis TaxID=2080755 RepID=A0A432MGV8_9BACT|nr:DUF255 domain-containing protein [Tautonia sociabilis]RUL86179.1 DUF255 domain-containing protein [Tautonia sociabilis]
MRRPAATIPPPAPPLGRPAPLLGPVAALVALLPVLGLGCRGSIAKDEPPIPVATQTPARADTEPAEVPAPAPEGRNRLGEQTSPYLLQHEHNPVHWYAWGPEAFAAAKAQDKPVFLSVGYRSCYWCHVMERECFMDEGIAALLNEHFISIKVDREERPDVDQVYMTALQAIANGRGGWPMSMFLTPDGLPFYGGTYFPPEPRDGMPSFPQLLEAIRDAWAERRAEVEQDAEALTAYVRRVFDLGIALEEVPLNRELASSGIPALLAEYDPQHGGFGFSPARPEGPKFPEPVNLVYLIDQHRRGRSAPPGAPDLLSVVLKTLDRMARGGIRDHLAGGYHRYSTDRAWQVPHFEKMLYDNAQLVPVFLDAFELTGDERWAAEARATLDFVADVMAAPDGGFSSSIDAESDEEEGRFYVWTRDQVQDVLGDDASYTLFATVFGLDREPNFEGDRYVLTRPDTPGSEAVTLGLAPEQVEDALAPLREKLLEARRTREMPFIDDTVLTSWNGLMIGAFADAARLLDSPRYLEISSNAAAFVLDSLRDDDGHLLRAYRSGSGKLAGYLEDHAYLIDGLLRLHKATGDPLWLDEARSLADRMIDAFADPRGGFFFTADDHERLVARVKEPFDGELPGPNAVAIRNLISLHRLTGEGSYLELAASALSAFAPAVSRSAGSAPMMLLAVDEYLDVQDGPKDEAASSSPAFVPGELRLPPGEGNPTPAGPSIVTARADSPADPIRPGQPFEVRVTLTIADPYHLNANPAGAANLIPTTLALPKDAPAALVSVDYPAGSPLSLAGQDDPIPVYDGTATLVAHLRLPADAPAGPSSLPIVIRYQACDDRSCLAPALLEFNVPIEVAPVDPEP